MSVHPAGGPSPQAAADAVLVMDAPAAAAHVAALVHAEFPAVRVVGVTDRDTFLARLHDGPWSVVIVSFDAPGYPGAMALRDALRLQPAPVIAVATDPSADDVAAALRAGAEDVIERARQPVLAARLGRLLGAARMQPRAGERAGRLAHAFAHAPQRRALLLLDRQWRVTDCSGDVDGVLGASPAELVGLSLETFFAGVPEGPEVLRRLRACRSGTPYGGSAWMQRRDRLRMRADLTCVADLDQQGEAHRFVLTVRDATLQYRATQSVRHQADAAVASAAGHNLFLGSIAHELRGALAPIATSAIVLDRPALPAAQQERLVGIIRRNAAAAARLVEDLLTVSTAAQDKLLMRQDELDLRQLVAECVEVAQHHARAANVDLAVECASPAGDTRLTCDADRIRQVLVNLIGNAIKFTPAGGSVRVRTTGGPDAVQVEVIDTGAGIDPAVLPFIFAPFEQGGAAVTARFGGFGLGLAICAAIAKLHGGSIAAASSGVGQGATFTLALPRQSAAAGPGPGPAREATALHVLYIEDNADAADAMRYALTKLEWTMTHAGTCAQARALVRDAATRFDVVLADLGLPDGSGLELGQELSHELPVVALTAYGAPMGIEGFASQLMKPAEIGELRRALLQAVASRRNMAVG